MKKYLFLLCTGLLILLAQCTPDQLNEEFPDDNPIIGCWINPAYDAEMTIYERGSSLPDDAPGICFKADGTLIQNKNAGWCGTPPITYGNFDGTWTLEDSILTMNVDSWNGYYESLWELISVDGETLTLKYVP